MIGMSDDPDSPGSGEEEVWSEVDEAFPDGAAAVRRDGFTPKRRRVFLKTLRKTGCVQDACRRVGISDTAADPRPNRSASGPCGDSPMVTANIGTIRVRPA